MIRSLRGLALAFIDAVLAVAACGCTTRLPTYPAMNDPASLELIAHRLEQVHAISARCDIVLQDAQGNSVRLNGAMLAAPPDCLRLRAWKMDFTVFDLTFVHGDTWLHMASDPGMQGRGAALDGSQASRIGPLFAAMGPTFFRTAAPLPEQSDSERLLVRGTVFQSGDMLCEIDRRTLTPRRLTPFEATDADVRVLLQRYEMLGKTAWPTEIDLRSGAGRMLLRWSDIEINATLPAGAFVPSPRAVKQP